MSNSPEKKEYPAAREKLLGLSLESTRKSYYPLLRRQLRLAEENERKLKLLIDHLPAWVSYVDNLERYVFVNREYEKIFGLKSDQIIGRRVQSLFGADNYVIVKNHVHEALQGNQVHFEMEFVSPDKKKHWLEIRYVPDISSKGVINGFYSLTLDQTEKKHAAKEKAKLESTLHQIQKHEAIGTLAGGIAHDFNNLLMGIQGRTSLMSVNLDLSHPHMEHIRAIDSYIQSAVNLTRQLLGIARGGKYEVTAFNINDLIMESSNLFGRTRKEIRIHTRMEKPLLAVEADKRQLEQVFLNMYLNAWQAMPDGGDLHLDTGTVFFDEIFADLHEIEPGPYVKVSVTDTGVGMNQDTCQKVFDPFFTTKEKSRGTGLGLASAYGIIKNHGGLVTVYSVVGQGTTFTIYLPLSHKEVLEENPVEEKMIKGSETVLLVDDEKIIIDVGRALLEKMGYRVKIANGGQQAVEMVQNEKNDIDLVILDLIMPGMDGGRTFDRIRKINPKLPVILSSGYAINGKATEIMDKGCNGFIQKPFNISQLSQKIQMVLHQGQISGTL